MATLFALVYPEESTAEQAMETARGLEDAGYMKILQRALVTKGMDGEIHIADEMHPVLKGAGVGAVIGGLVGAVFLIPVAGLALGAALGGVIGRSGGSGAEEDFKSFQSTVTQELQPGGAALLLLAQSDSPDRVVQNLSAFGGKILSHDLSDAQLADLQKEIDRASKS